MLKKTFLFGLLLAACAWLPIGGGLSAAPQTNGESKELAWRGGRGYYGYGWRGYYGSPYYSSYYSYPYSYSSSYGYYPYNYSYYYNW